MLQQDIAFIQTRRQDATTVELAEKTAERAMYLEWYAIRLGNIVIVIPKEEGYVDRDQ